MKFQNILSIFLLLFSLSFQAQQDTIKNKLKALKIFQRKTSKDDFGNVFYYDEKAKAKFTKSTGEKVVVMDELLLMQDHIFNNQLDHNFYYFLNKN